MSDLPVRPRTKEERVAYMSGYANAIRDVVERGVDGARRWLMEMVEIEDPEMAEEIKKEIKERT